MYRTPRGESYGYTCGYYQQSHGSECAHNHIDGPTAVRFVLAVIRQNTIQPHRLPQLDVELRCLSVADRRLPLPEPTARVRAELNQARDQLETVKRNLALAKTPDQYDTIASIFEELRRREESLADELRQAEAVADQTVDVEQQIKHVLESVRRLPVLLDGSDSSGRVAREVFEAVGARLFLSFERVQVGKRLLNCVKSGVVTVGDAADHALRRPDEPP